MLGASHQIVSQETPEDNLFDTLRTLKTFKSTEDETARLSIVCYRGVGGGMCRSAVSAGNVTKLHVGKWVEICVKKLTDGSLAGAGW